MNCKNCQAILSENGEYCYSCGGKVIRNRLTIKNLFEDFTTTFFNYDNKFFKTFITLFKKPEDVIGSYIDGTRKKYLDVISYFMVALTVTGFEWLILKRFFPELLDLSDISYQENAKFTNDIFNFVQNNSSVVMMLFVPIYALISRIVFINKKKYNYTEHLVIFMYVLAQITLLGTALNILGALLGFSLGKLIYLNLPLQIVYSAYCLKKLYTLSLKGIMLRTLFFILVFLVFYAITIIVIALSLYLIQGPEYLKALMHTQ
ncbi:MAG: DUF3667 domain-containing protein [Aquaticitalea sp.]